MVRRVLLVAFVCVACGGDDPPAAPDADRTMPDAGGAADAPVTMADAGPPDATPVPPDAMIPVTCGDSIVDLANGEQCDDGNNTSGDGCSAACQVEVGPGCGNGTTEPANGEQCDDGNTASGDGCGPTCQFETLGASCGDSVVDPLEVCDDGNLMNGDGCNPTCNSTTTTSLFVGMPGVPGLVDGTGTMARIGGPGVLAVDDQYLYFGDSVNHVIRRINVSTGLVQTVAGDGTGGFADDPIGTNARFGAIEALATDGVTLWAADGPNGRIRAIELTSGLFGVTTVAGPGAMGAGNYTDGIGPLAGFDDPRGLTYFDGNVYLLDAQASTLRRFEPATGEVLTIAGFPYMPGSTDGVASAARFISPRYMASNNSGMLYISDTNGFAIRAYNTVTGAVTTFAGTGMQEYIDGAGTAAGIHRPRGMASDGTSLYFNEFNRHTVRQAVLSTAEVTTLAGQHCWPMTPCPGYAEGIGTAAVFDSPWGLAYHYPTSSLFVVDGANYVIRRIQ